MNPSLRLCIAALLILAVSAKYVTFTTCTDKAYCANATCTSQTLPADSCLPNNGGSMTVTCMPSALLCLQRYEFGADASCKTATASDVLICDRCYSNKNSSTAEWKSPKCFMSDSGAALVNVSICQDEQNPAYCGCTKPLVAVQWEQGVCHARKAAVGNRYSMLQGYSACAFVFQRTYTTPDCSGTMTPNYIPSGSFCQAGVQVRCHGDF